MSDETHGSTPLSQHEQAQRPAQPHKPEEPGTANRGVHPSIWQVLLRCVADGSGTPLLQYLESNWGTIKTFWKEERPVCIIYALTFLIVGWYVQDLRYADVKSERDTAQTRLAPFLAVADKQFTTNPQNERLTLLVEKLNQKLEKAPRFEIYVNDFVLGTNECVTFPTTNDSQPLVFIVKNTGDAAADKLVLDVVLPSQLNVIPDRNWRPGGVAFNNSDRVNYINDKVYFCEGDVTLFPGQGTVFQPLTIQATNLNRTVNSFAISARSKDSSLTRVAVWIHFTNGIGPAHLGY